MQLEELVFAKQKASQEISLGTEQKEGWLEYTGKMEFLTMQQIVRRSAHSEQLVESIWQSP